MQSLSPGRAIINSLADYDLRLAKAHFNAHRKLTHANLLKISSDHEVMMWYHLLDWARFKHI